jgi:hypothetical protein
MRPPHEELVVLAATLQGTPRGTDAAAMRRQKS